MALPSAGAHADVPLAPLQDRSIAAVDTTQLDKLVETALTADKSHRHALYGRAAEEALRLNGETFVCTYLTLKRADSLLDQSQLRA